MAVLRFVYHSQRAFAHFSKANQYSLASIENELSNDSLLDTEFDKHMLDSNQLDNDRGSHTFTDTGATTAHASLANSNPLEAAVNAVKKYGVSLIPGSGSPIIDSMHLMLADYTVRSR